MPSAPFSFDHFQEWAQGLILDTGQPWQLEPFQLSFLEDVFKGFRENWLIVPEGNGKTTLVAGIALYHLRFSEDASIPIAASSRDQVRIMYRQAKGFIRRSRLFEPDEEGIWFEAFDGYRRIDLRGPMQRNRRGETLGVIEVHAADAGTGDGVIPTLAILDELHRHKSLELYETWRGKMDKRDGQLIVISTAGEPGSEFEDARKTVRESGKRKREGRTFARVEGPGIVLHEWALDENGDANDLDLVAEANPYSALTKKVLAAKKASPTLSEAHWRRFTCNIASQTAAQLYIDLASWNACERAEIEPGAYIAIGADGSRTWDTTVVAWAHPFEDGFIDVACRVFSVRSNIAYHVLHQGGRIDFDDVETFLLDLWDRFSPQGAAFDPRYLERSMEIAAERLPEASVIAVEPHTKAARDAYQALYTAVIEGKLRHDGDPVIAAHLANCAVDREERTQEIRRLRKIDPRKPIDAVPALALAVWLAVVAEPVEPAFAFG